MSLQQNYVIVPQQDIRGGSYYREPRTSAMTSAQFNPCCFWGLKDGCMIVGIWSVVWSIVQLGIFSWQTAVVKFFRDRMEYRRVPAYQSYSVYDNRLGGGDWSQIYVTPEEKIYMALFIIQIMHLVAAFALLFASASLLFGVHTSSKFLVWPWFPCMIASIICSLAYCITWWIGSVSGYHIALTVVQFIALVINIYCIICVYGIYRRFATGHARRKKEEPKQIIYEYKADQQTEPYSRNRYLNEEPVIPGQAYWNQNYEQDNARFQEPKVSMYTSDPQPDQFENQQYYREENLQGPPYVIEDQAQFNTDQEPILDQQQDQHQHNVDPFKDQFLRQVIEETPPQPELQRSELRRSTGDAEYDQNRSSRPRTSSCRHRSGDRDEERHRSRSRSIKSGDPKNQNQIEPTRHNQHGHRNDPCSSTSHHHQDSRVKPKQPQDDTRSRRDRSDSRSRHSCGHYERKRSRSRHTADDSSPSPTRRRDAKKESKDDAAAKRSVRSVKRDADAREKRKELTKSTASSTSPTPMIGPGGGICIPQNIVVPAQADRRTPQRYQISSEVTISYGGAAASTAPNSAVNSTGTTPQPTAVAPTVTQTQPNRPVAQGGATTGGASTRHTTTPQSSEVEGRMSTDTTAV